MYLRSSFPPLWHDAPRRESRPGMNRIEFIVAANLLGADVVGRAVGFSGLALGGVFVV